MALSKQEFKPNVLNPIPVHRSLFIKHWLMLMKPWHKLTDKEQDVAAAYITKYLEFSKSIPNNIELRNKCLFSIETQKEICLMCEIKNNLIQPYKGRLRKAGFFTSSGEINPVLIPNRYNDLDSIFTALFVFKIIDDELESSTNIQRGSDIVESSREFDSENV